MTIPEPLDGSDEMLMALADGELDDATAERLWTRIESDPALAARFSRFSETRKALRDAYPSDPLPDHLIASIMASSPRTATILPLRKRPKAPPVARWALAASLLLAVGLGGFLAGQEAPGAASVPLLQAAGSLALAPTGETDGTARVLASYETELGLCRLIEAGAERGLVCRDGETWSLALAVASATGDAFLPASDLGTALIDAALDELGAGPPLDPAAEAAALAD